MANYISMKSSLSPKRLWNEVAEGGECPWVRIGNLYASVTFTGSESWEPLVQDLMKKGQKKFAILAGRHGDQLGTQIDPINHTFVPRDPSSPSDSAIDPEDDKKQAAAFNKKGGGMDVVVVDVGGTGHNTVESLQRAITGFLMTDTVVILAWCYSLYAMKPGWYGSLKGVWPQAFAGADMVPVEYTARDWSWVLRYPTSPASNLAGAQARTDR